MIQSNRRVRFLASVKMAILLFIVLILAISLGTLIESRYNAEYARRFVYQTWPFACLGFLFAANIFLSTLTRWPWKKNHIGFLVTHLGLLILIAGSFVTAFWGVDGQLFVEESQKAHTVWANERSLELLEKSGQKSLSIPLGHPLLIGRSLDVLNFRSQSPIKIASILDYVDSESLNSNLFRVNIKSNFFNESILLTPSQPELDLGPARFVWRTEESKDLPSKSLNQQMTVKIESLEGKWLQSFDPLREKKVRTQNITVRVQKILSRATINGAGIVEGERENPAVELLVEYGKRQFREVLFSRFPQFSLIKPGDLPIKLTLSKDEPLKSTPLQDKASQEEPLKSAPLQSTELSQGAATKPTFLFFTEGEIPWVEFQKNGETQKARLDQGEVAAPWMGIRVSARVWPSTRERIPTAILPKPKSKELPPSALKLKSDQQELWIAEGEYKSINTTQGRVDLYYGPKPIRLPFSVELIKFSKENYLGTETAKNFESTVRIAPIESGSSASSSGGSASLHNANSDNANSHTGAKASTLADSEASGPVTIAMNTPFKYAGYTIYQSAYQELPDGRFVSIFSVNQDPGRWIKYLGTLITSLGILIFIVTKRQKKQVIL